MRGSSIFATTFILFIGLFTFIGCREEPASEKVTSNDGTKRVGVTFSGGHETDPVDHGRPVMLIAAALGVPPEVFREAFSRVKPAPAGTRPDRHRVRENKKVLMNALGPYGITNKRLDTVSNYYRYNPGQGEMWPTDEAVAYAMVEDGRIIGFEVTEGGSGYSSPPVVTVPGLGKLESEVHLSFGQDFDRNGSVVSIEVLE